MLFRPYLTSSAANYKNNNCYLNRKKTKQDIIMFFKKKPCLNLEEKTYVNDKYIYKKKIARQNTAQPFGI